MAEPMTSLETRQPSEVEGEAPGTLRRIGAISGLITILVLDLIALDDITTAGAWMPEILVLLASIPALVTLGHLSKRPGSRGPLGTGGAARGRLGSGEPLPSPGERDDV